MKLTKITTSFIRFGDDQLEGHALAVAAALNGNTNFTDPIPALADLNNSIKLFSDALALAKTRDKVKIAIKNKLRNDLELMLLKLANYCTHVANGDRAILASSGFPLNAESITSKTLGSPENFTVQVGSNSGEAFVFINPVQHAKSYLFLYGPSPVANEAWIHAVNSVPYHTITGLTPGTTYSFKIGAAGSKSQVAYTDIVSKMIV